jgi:hypothetical protein
MNASATDAIGVRLAELVATFALGQDNAFGQPMGSQLRSCLVASRLGESMDLGDADRRGRPG